MGERKDEHYSSLQNIPNHLIVPSQINLIGFSRIRSQTTINVSSECELENEIVPRVYKCYQSEEIIHKRSSITVCGIKIPEISSEPLNIEECFDDNSSDPSGCSRSRVCYSVGSVDTINTPDPIRKKRIQLENPGWRFGCYEFEDIFSESKSSALRRVLSVDLSNDVQLAKPSLFDQARRNSFCIRDKFMGKVFGAADISIENIIGEGFFGRVYKIIDRTTNQLMVMKELKCTDVRAQKQFITEIELVRHLNHPNLVKYIGVIFIKRKISVILEYIEYGTLRKLIKDSTIVISQKNKVKIALDISSGMSYLHSKRIAHRDLTSKNCLIRDLKDFDAVVSDFGLSRVIHRIPTFVPTKQPIKLETVGSAFWMAPEMLMGYDYDHTVDIFSYGIVICELLSRTNAHPDNIPRLNNFGLDDHGFLEKIRNISNPHLLINIAVKCCRIIPSNRPSFLGIRHSLQRRYELNYRDDNCENHVDNYYLHPIVHSKSSI